MEGRNPYAVKAVQGGDYAETYALLAVALEISLLHTMIRRHVLDNGSIVNSDDDR